MTQEQNSVQWVYASKNEQEVRERYDQWAKTYEADLEKTLAGVGRCEPLRRVSDRSPRTREFSMQGPALGW